MTHLHRGHPCTLAVPHLHYPLWLRSMLEVRGDTPSAMLYWLWWPQRRPRRAAA